MADLLPFLITRKLSQESFHSACSQPNPQQRPLADPDDIGHGASSQGGPTLYIGDLAVHDINAYLLDPARQPAADDGRPAAAAAATQPPPVQLGTSKSSQYISQLAEICTKRGLAPLYDFEPRQTSFGLRYTGTLTLAGHTIRLPFPEPSKKDAKQVLAEMGCALVETLAPASPPNHDPSAPPENWIGKLLEYYNSLPANLTSPGPVYTLYTPTPNTFTCEVLLPECPTPFGSRTSPHRSKKAAKAAAAAAAVQFLISTGALSPTGTVLSATKGRPKNKAPELQPARRRSTTSTSTDGADDPATGGGYVQRVEALCAVLGLAAPVYTLAGSPDAGNVWSGAARFVGEPEILQPLGEVRNVFGKRRAKDECARGVWVYLEGLRRARSAGRRVVKVGVGC